MDGLCCCSLAPVQFSRSCSLSLELLCKGVDTLTLAHAGCIIALLLLLLLLLLLTLLHCEKNERTKIEETSDCLNWHNDLIKHKYLHCAWAREEDGNGAGDGD